MTIFLTPWEMTHSTRSTNSSEIVPKNKFLNEVIERNGKKVVYRKLGRLQLDPEVEDLVGESVEHCPDCRLRC